MKKADFRTINNIIKEYKRGDWVVNHTTPYLINRPFKISSIVEGQGIQYGGMFISNGNFKYWYPEIGEWCWKGIELILIVDIKNLDRDDGLLTYSYRVSSKSNIYTSSFKPEPFIGELPSICKEVGV